MAELKTEYPYQVFNTGRAGGKGGGEYPMGGINGFRYHGISWGVQVDAHAARHFFDIQIAFKPAAFCPNRRLQAVASLSVFNVLLRVRFVLVSASKHAEPACGAIV